MSHAIGQIISASTKLAIGYAGKLLNEIPDEKFSAYARVGDQVIESNHPAFICGHLSLYSSTIIEELGLDASDIKAPESYQNLFSHGVDCVDDPDQKIYPAAEELKTQMINGYQRVIEVLEQTEDAAFMVENPNESLSGRFPTKGAMHTFYVGGHFMVHMGQLSAWRRAIGLGAA